MFVTKRIVNLSLELGLLGEYNLINFPKTDEDWRVSSNIPTLYDLHLELIKKHNIIVCVLPSIDSDENLFFVRICNTFTGVISFDLPNSSKIDLVGYYKDYNEAFEIGLYNGLKLIKEQKKKT
jgi:hypothetical protein